MKCLILINQPTPSLSASAPDSSLNASAVWESESDSFVSAPPKTARWLTEAAAKRGSIALLKPYEVMKKTGFESARIPMCLFVASIGLLNACCGRKRAECVCHPSEKLSDSVPSKKIYKYNKNNLPTYPSLPSRFDSVYVACTQREIVRRAAKPRQSCLQCGVREVGENSCKRIPNINKLYEAYLSKKKGFGESSERSSTLQISRTDVWIFQKYPTSGEAMV